MKSYAATAVPEAQHAPTPPDRLQEEGAVMHVGGGEALTPSACRSYCVQT